MQKHDNGDIATLNKDYINSFKRQIQCLKEQLDKQSSHNRALHDKQAELRQYSSELKERAESLYIKQGLDMPESIANAPASLMENDKLQKSKEVFWENESAVLQGQVDQLYAEITML